MTSRFIVTVVVFVGLSAFLAPAQEKADKAAAPKAPAETPSGLPEVTAKAWIIIDGKTGEMLKGFNETGQRAIASTTKIMTGYLVLKLAQEDPKLLDEEMVFSQRAARVRGSSSKLRAGEKLPVREMLYGMFLPSGNDAAVALAEKFGPRFKTKGEKSEEDPVQLFVDEMNREGKAVGMKNTLYEDPNGLRRNGSTARDLATLAAHALNNKAFQEYVKTKTHSYEVTGPDGRKRTVTWNNTNKLLGQEGFDGVKTGTTGAAGNCLVASWRQGPNHLIVVVLGSASSDGKYDEVRDLFAWAWKQRGYKVELKDKPKEKEKVKAKAAV